LGIFDLAQEKLLFYVMTQEFKKLVWHMNKGIKRQCKLVNLLLLLVVILTSSNSSANPLSDINKEDQEWARGLVNKSLKMTMEGIKGKYLELQRMLGVVSEDISYEEGLQELFKPAAILRVFVSSSMSHQLLKSYVKEAEKYGAILVFKGLPNGSWRELSKLVSDISNESDNVAMQIDDEAFSKFGISSVPSFVLSSEPRDNWQEEENKRGGRTFDKVIGNVGIRGALTLMAEQGDMADEASSILEERKN